MEKGTTYMVRPFMHPRKSPLSLVRISSGHTSCSWDSVDLLLRADVRAVFDASNVTRVRESVVTVGTLLGVQSTERSGFDETLAELSYSASDPSHQWIRSGVVTFATNSTQAMSFLLVLGTS